MKISRLARALLAVALVVSGIAAPASDRAPDRPRLETVGARSLQELAASIAVSPEIARIKADLTALMRRDPQAATPDGVATLETALDEITLSFITQAVTFDTEHPQLLWWNTPPYTYQGTHVPGARFALDNPDNINQIASLDPTVTYVIRGKRRGTGPSQITFVIYQAYLINHRNPNQMAEEEATLVGPKVEDDGSYTVTIGPEPAAGRTNYIQNNSGRPIFAHSADSLRLGSARP